MNLCRLIYFSERKPGAAIDIKQIVAVSQRNNSRNQVGGVLYYDDIYFVQALEGRRSRVTQTYNKLCNDPRHCNLYLVSCLDIRERLFPNWSMALHTELDAQSRELMTSFFSLSKFDPENVTVEDMVYFFQILASNLKRRGSG
jgi:hypothetical protein